MDMVNVILVGGPYAGWKTRVPAEVKAMKIDDGNQVTVARSMTQLRKIPGAPKEGTVYMLHPCTIASPTFNDAVTFVIGTPPGEKMSDAFMSIMAGYCMMCRPEDYEADDTKVADILPPPLEGG